MHGARCTRRFLHPRTFRTLAGSRALALLLVGLGLVGAVPGTVSARVIPIPASFRIGPPQGGSGDGLTVRFKDVTNSDCGLSLCKIATDSVTVQVTTMSNVNFLLNQGCTFGPFDHGCGYFQTRWDSYLDIRVPGDYVFSMQVDDQGTVAVGDSTILFLDGAYWFQNVISDTVRFESSGSYPLRAYYADCQPCCRGFRLGGMGPAGSGLMAFTAGFNFNGDLGPCCTFGSNGPGLSLVPSALFFRSAPTVSVPAADIDPGSRTITRCWASPNPAQGRVVLAL
ncbi:MAG: PA14 domain-containing protein, partial [Candidatus Eisenbacteria bacterium]